MGGREKELGKDLRLELNPGPQVYAMFALANCTIATNDIGQFVILK